MLPLKGFRFGFPSCQHQVVFLQPYSKDTGDVETVDDSLGQVDGNKSPVVNKKLRLKIFTKLIFLLEVIPIPGVPIINLRGVTNPTHSKKCIFEVFVILLPSVGLHTCLR